jgi:hypothetical protein
MAISPPDNSTKLRIAEFPALDTDTEAKVELKFLWKTIGGYAPPEAC